MSALLSARGLTKLFPVAHAGRRARLHAVDGVDLVIGQGECLGIVGESGCGKSTLARLLARLIEPTGGTIAFAGAELTATPLHRFWRSPDRAKIQMVFQDPTESLAPHLTAFDAVADPVRRLRAISDASRLRETVMASFALVGLPPELATRYPHQLSGGQKARVGIARAVAVEPRLLILDEPTAALDVSVQSVILKLLADLRRRLGMSYAFVSHDLNIVRLLCDRIVVMYLGRIVEEAPVHELFRAPRHPYTRALLAAIPDPTRGMDRPDRLDGVASSPIDPDPNRCRFSGRCPVEVARCGREMPVLHQVGDGHRTACHLAT